MPSEEKINLDDARKDDNIEQFIEEHPSKADRSLFGKLLDRMIKGKPPKSSKEDGQT